MASIEKASKRISAVAFYKSKMANESKQTHSSSEVEPEEIEDTPAEKPKRGRKMFSKMANESKQTHSSSEVEPEEIEDTPAVKPKRGRKRKYPQSRPESRKANSQNDQADVHENGHSSSFNFTNKFSKVFSNVEVKQDNRTRERAHKENFQRGREHKENSQRGRYHKENSQRETSLCGYRAAEEAFKWLIEPTSINEFTEMIMDKKPHHIARHNSDYYKGLFSSKDFDKIIKENNLEYDKEIDIVTYIDGKRVPTTNEMNVHPTFVWKCYKEGNSIRMRNPQIYHPGLYKICVLLQEYFGSYCGSNMYLTPPNAQGFPPHYDDIDAFILQIEGKKIWRIYDPINSEDILARFSSGDLEETELGEPSMEIELCAGDLLYFPRGYIHQAETPEGVHSLHITLSTNQLNTWGDLLLAGMNHALEKAIKNEIELRETLPLHYMNYVGSTYAKSNSVERKDIKKKFKSAAQLVLQHLSVDFAADQHVADFMYGSAPPFFDQLERACSIHGNGCQLNENGEVTDVVGLTEETKIRWIRKRMLRLVIDDTGARLFHTLGNSKNHKESEALFMEIDSDTIPAINFLFQSYPEFVRVADLPAKNFKVELAQQLYDNGFLMTEVPLEFEETTESPESH